MRRNKVIGEDKKSQLHAVVFSDESQTISSLKKSQLDYYDELESYKRLRKRRIKIACCRLAIWCFAILLIPIFVFLSIVIVNPSSGHDFFGYTFYIIVSDSMKPSIQVNDCIVVQRVKGEDEIEIGDDITFIRESDGATVTHRVVAIVEEKGNLGFITKGTHNGAVDAGIVSFTNIIGRRVATIGWLGQIVMFFRTSYGLITFFLLLATIMGLFLISFRISEDIRAVGK